MENKSNHLAAAILGLLVCIGLAAAGYFVSTTLYKGRLASNTVTVKGFAERDVKADLALWQISYSITGGNLGALYAQSSANETALSGFLAQKGFRKDEIKSGALQVNDLLANQYRNTNISEAQRYIISNTITVRSNN